MDADDDDELVGASRGELGVPVATVTRLVKEALPEGVKCDQAVSPLIAACLAEFVQMVAAQANGCATKEKKKTITETHALAALDELGFGHYATACKPAAGSSADAADGGAAAGGRKKGKRKLPEHSGLSQEELLRQQQALFAGAAATFGAGAAAASAPPPEAQPAADAPEGG